GAPAGPPFLAPGHRAVNDVSHDGRLVSLMQNSGRGLVLDRGTGRPVAAPPLPSPAKTQGVPSMLHFAPGDRVLVSCEPQRSRQRFWKLDAPGAEPLSLSLEYGDSYHVTRDREGRDVVIVFRRRKGATGAVARAEL